MGANAAVSAYHSVDPVTGFLQSTGNYVTAFDSDRKQDFLKVYRANGLAFYRTCNELNLSRHTVNHHMEIDPQFKDAIETAKREYADDLEAKSRNVAITKDSATLERIFQLRALFPDKYARDLKGGTPVKIEINIAGDLLSKSKRHTEAIETSIESEIDSITVNDSTQMLPSPSEAHSSRELSWPDARREP